MKALIYVVLGGLIGGGISYLYTTNMYENRSEDIVKREIILLNKYSHIPSCEDLKDNHDSLVQNSQGEEHVFWSYVSKEHLLKKIVISSDFIVAYETVDKVCG